MTGTCSGWVPVLSHFSKLGHSYIPARRGKTDKDPPAATALGRAWTAHRTLSTSFAKSRALWFTAKVVAAWGWFAGSARVALAEQTIHRNGWAKRSLRGRGVGREEGCLDAAPAPAEPPSSASTTDSTAVLTQIQVRRRKRRRLEVMGDIWIISARLRVISFWSLRFKLMYSLAKSYSSFSGQVVIERNVIFLIKPEHLLPLGSAACNVPWGHGAFCNSYYNCNIWQQTFKNTVYRKF